VWCVVLVLVLMSVSVSVSLLVIVGTCVHVGGGVIQWFERIKLFSSSQYVLLHQVVMLRQVMMLCQVVLLRCVNGCLE
jgi:hypothetical protein